jgi:hypothetical protein
METKISQHDAVAAALVQMQTAGLNYGSFFPIEFLKKAAGPWGTEKTFHYFMILLSETLRKRGMCLTSANLNGTGFRVCQQVENYHVAQNWRGDAQRCFDRAITLLSNMERDALTAAEKLRDESALRKLRYERQLLNRSDDVIKVVRKHKPGIFRDDVEAASGASEDTDTPEGEPAPEA